MGKRYEINPDKTLMLGVDLQKAFGEAVDVPHASAAVENARKALDIWRPLGAVVLTRHVYTDPGEVGRLDDFIPGIYEALKTDSPLVELYEGVYEEGDILIDKTRYNALLGTRLTEILGERETETVVVCGLTTPICVESTVRALMMNDLRVVLLHDACASQALGNLTPKQAHDSAVQTMGALFAQPITTSEFIEQIS
ncbi:MAG: cysteine hydrolase [Patescibacteria group bacterium]